MKKRLFILVLTAALMGSLTACSTDTEADNAVPATEDIEATEQTDVVAELETETETETEDIIPETETEEPTEAVVPETETETEQAEAYTVTDMSATKYAKQSANVRKGPSKDYETIGSLGTNQQVTVTGQADTGWYRIEYNGGVAYVSNSLLVDNKVAVNTNSNTSADTSTVNQTATTDTNTSTPATGGDTGNSGYVDNSNTSTSTPATSTPAVDNSTPASTPTTDTSASTPTTSVDASGMTDEEMADLFESWGLSVEFGNEGGGEDVGVGGDWGHIE